MKSKVYAIRVSATIVFISLFVACVLTFYCEQTTMITFICSISLNILAGAIVSLIIYFTEYGPTKTDALESYYLASLELSRSFLNLKYLFFKEPDSLIKDKFREEYLNENIQKRINQIPDGISIPDDDFFRLKHNARDKLIEYIRPDYVKGYNTMPKEEYESILNDEVKLRMEKYREEIELIIDQYINLSKATDREVSNAYGRLYFLLGNKKKSYRSQIYVKHYSPQHDMLSKLKEKIYHLKLYRNGESSNLPVVIDFIIEIQNLLFTVTTDSQWEKVYSSFYDNIDDELEKIRAYMYGVSPEFQKHHPIHAITIHHK